ncbi:hypothetical protein, partial [Nocardia cyriacigeorgica]|uniref:hypothetical protein n=1 Tax=Nocardia cyriacigeorgica TaxID=135487 RepID=UPI002453E884
DVSYEVGDSLGVWPTNCSSLVQEWLDATGLDGQRTVEVDSTELPLAAHENVRAHSPRSVLLDSTRCT